jgi:hypothetical protein
MFISSADGFCKAVEIAIKNLMEETRTHVFVIAKGGGKLSTTFINDTMSGEQNGGKVYVFVGLPNNNKDV